MSAEYDERSLRWVYDNYAKGKVKEMVNQYRLYFGRCDDVGSMVELHRLAKQRFYDFENQPDTISQRTIDQAYMSLMAETIVQALYDYREAKVKGNDEEIDKIEDWIMNGNFWLFNFYDIDEQTVLKRFREYDGKRISFAIKDCPK